MVLRDFIFTFFVFAILGISTIKSANTNDLITSKSNSNNDPIVAAIDSLVKLKSIQSSDFSDDINLLNKYNFAKDSIPIYTDLVYEFRIEELNGKTPIELEYNDAVKHYIELYTIKRRNQVSTMLGLAELYFPLFEEHLDKSNLPLELKYLAIVESALNPNAKSPSGAMGLWQFLLNAGKMFDLNVDSYVDERCDPYKSTVAACKYLEYLHRIFNDWQLALAAYNGGPGVVRNAIQRSGGKTTFWEIRPFLPKETQGYVPAFIAATYVMNYSAEHNIYPTKPKIFFNQTDTVHVKQSVNFNQISAFTDVPIDMIKFLNPSYKQNFIPYSNDEKILILPSEKISSFIKFEKEIYGLKTEKNDYNKLVANAGATDNKVKVVHVVKKGEYFHKIAMDYKCTVDNLIAWNNLSSYYLYAGQKLEIWVNPTYELMPESKTDLPKLVYYTVQYGDSIQSIANKFNIASASEILKENNISSESQLQPGVKLKIVSGTSN